jgi:hypothetical protein
MYLQLKGIPVTVETPSETRPKPSHLAIPELLRDLIDLNERIYRLGDTNSDTARATYAQDLRPYFDAQYDVALASEVQARARAGNSDCVSFLAAVDTIRTSRCAAAKPSLELSASTLASEFASILPYEARGGRKIEAIDKFSYIPNPNPPKGVYVNPYPADSARWG